jgi:hypothetical protein
MSAEWVAAWGQIAGAAGSFVAVAVALWIALRDSSVRRKEQSARASAQAKLVVVTRPYVVDLNRDGEPDSIHHDLQFTISNHGDRPILDVRAVVWLVEPTGRKFDRAERVLLRDQKIELDVRVHGKVRRSMVAAWRVQWTDADGRHWAVDRPNDGVRRVSPDEPARPLPEPWKLPER